MKYLRLIILSLMLTIVNADTDLKKIFKESNINGTLVLSTLDGNKSYIHNPIRVEKRYLPASTFKIPNTLIVLEERIIKDEYETIKWDGKKRSYSFWNKDQDLKSAISFSCVWCYQRFAKKVGNEKYLNYLQKIDYGNKQTGSDLTTFWLEGDLRISAMEQIQFLKKLYNNDLPFSKNSLKITKKVLIVEDNDKYTLRAKTGWTGKIGWYIGYIQTKSNTWFFALNAEISKETLKLRKQLLIDALKIKKII